VLPAHLAKHPIRRAQLVQLLAPTLGQEKSESLVVATGRALGMQLGDTMLLEQAVLILERLAEAEGIVGVVARFVQVRGELEALARRAAEPAPVRPAPHAPVAAIAGSAPAAPTAHRQPIEPPIAVEEIIALLAPALGDSVARDTVTRYAANLGAVSSQLTRAQATAMLESMSQANGTLGVVASFAKARLILQRRG
jgi:hypothetical protein